MLETSRRWRARHPEKRKQVARDWGRRNSKQLVKKRLQRYKTDPLFNLVVKMRRRLWMAMKTAKANKKDSTIKIIGCSYNELKAHIEARFTDGMSWDLVTAGQIHFDHVKPLAAFNITDPDQLRAAFHYSNLAPEWAGKNYSKNSTYQGRRWRHSDHACQPAQSVQAPPP
jgi:hypothetical protein